MNNLKSRQLLLSIAVISLMISATVLVQSASGTALSGTIQKSITMNAGTDGRSFSVVNGTWYVPSIQKVDYTNPFTIYSIAYGSTSPATTTSYSLPSPVYGTPSSSYNPSIYPSLGTGLGPSSSVPKFLIARNTTNNIVSPTITLTSRDNISLGIGVASEIQVDAMNPTVATIAMSSSAVGQLAAFSGLVTGGTVSVHMYDPYGNYITFPSLSAGYFAIPMEIYTAGIYGLYFTSTTSAYVTVTPSFVSATSTTVGQFATGTMKIPDTLTLDTLISGDQLPSQIVALSYDVNKGDQYALSFTANELLTGISSSPSQSDYACYYFEVGTNATGMSRVGILGVGGAGASQPVVSEAVVSGKVYIVLVSNYISRFQYTMGAETATVPTAPLNTSWQLALPTGAGMLSQLYTFSIPSESMVIMNYSNYVHPGTPIQAAISKVTPAGTVYSTALSNLGTGYFFSGLAESNYASAMYMGAGDYMLYFATASATNPPSATFEINAYPIANFTSGSSLSLGVGTTIAFSIDNLSPASYHAFNVTLTTQLNASMFYRMTVYDSHNTMVSSYAADGSSSSNAGIGNKQANSGAPFLGTSGAFFTDPSLSGAKNFGGNKTAQINQFVSAYNKYFIILSFLNGYNTTTSGGTNPTRWLFYKNLVMTLKIDLSAPNLANVLNAGAVYEIRYVMLDSSSGSGATSVTFTSTAAANTRLIALQLTSMINTWTRITVTITNGTAGGNVNGTRSSNLELLYDTLRYGQNTFDSGNALPLLPSLTYYMVRGSSSPRSVTYAIEFGAFTGNMMIAFLPVLYGSATAAHTVVGITVNHFATPGISGLAPTTGATPAGPPGAPFPLEIALIIIVVVAVALVVVFIVVKKRSGSSGSRS